MGKNLRELRLAHDLEQADLAEAMGYRTSASVSLIETGKKGIPQKRLEAAARLLGVAPEVIAGVTK